MIVRNKWIMSKQVPPWVIFRSCKILYNRSGTNSKEPCRVPLGIIGWMAQLKMKPCWQCLKRYRRGHRFDHDFRFFSTLQIYDRSYSFAFFAFYEKLHKHLEEAIVKTIFVKENAQTKENWRVIVYSETTGLAKTFYQQAFCKVDSIMDSPSKNMFDQVKFRSIYLFNTSVMSGEYNIWSQLNL